MNEHNPPKALKEKINKFIEESNVLSRKRNRAIHDPWVTKKNNPDSLFRLEVTAEKRLVLEFKPIEIEQLHELAIEIENFRLKFNQLCNEINSAFGTSL